MAESKDRVEYRYITNEKEKEVEVKIPLIPKSCTEAGKLGQVAADASNQIASVTTAEVLEILSNTRIAAASSDTMAANDLDTQTRKLQRKVISEIETLAINREPLSAALAACENGDIQ